MPHNSADWLLHQPPESEPARSGSLLDDLDPDVRKRVTHRANLILGTALSARKLLAAADIVLEYTLPGLVRGTLGLMVGAGASSKSTLALYAAISVALGRDVFGAFPDVAFTRGRVIFLSLEDAKVPLAQRYQRLLRTLPRHLQEQIMQAEDDGWIHIVPQLESGLTPFTRNARTREIVPTDDLLALGEMCRGVSLVVIDTLSVLCGPSSLEENSNTDMGPLISSLNRIAGRHNCAIVLLHHVAKGDDTGQGRGASAIGDNARWRLSMRVMTKAEAEERFGSDELDERAAWILVEWTKQNYAPPRESIWLHREDGLLRAGMSPPSPERRPKKVPAATTSGVNGAVKPNAAQVLGVPAIGEDE